MVLCSLRFKHATGGLDLPPAHDVAPHRTREAKRAPAGFEAPGWFRGLPRNALASEAVQADAAKWIMKYTDLKRPRQCLCLDPDCCDMNVIKENKKRLSLLVHPDKLAPSLKEPFKDAFTILQNNYNVLRKELGYNAP
jgi:hypothetical protein